jgi:hypothetical protein
MRDPFKITRPVMFPQTHPCRLTNRGWGKLHPVHVHNAYPDAQGNGNTSISVSHYHRIVDGRVLPDESDGHTHTISNILCGTGI